MINIVFTEDDIKEMAAAAGIDESVALERANEWAPYIADTATMLCTQQLESAIETNTP